MSKSKQIKINLKEEDYSRIKEEANLSNLTMAAFIRKSTGSKNLVNKKEHSPDFKLLIYQVNKIGNNINQITKVIHADKMANKKMLDYLEIVQKQLALLIQKAEQLDS
jgi:hypothetical protein